MQFELPLWPKLKRLRREPAEDWLVVGAQRVRLRLVANRRARRYVLRLGRDGSARVTVPRGGKTGEARRFAEKNLGWLEKQLQRRAAEPLSQRAWTVGTEILFRGEKLRLEVEEEMPRCSDPTLQHRLVPTSPVGPLTPALSPSEGERENHRPISCENPLAGMPYADNRPWQDNDKIARTARKFPPLPFGRGEGRGEGCRFDVRLQREIHLRLGPEIFRVASATDNLRPAVERHLRRLAEAELPGRVRELATLHEIQIKRITVRNQRSRWGSCSRRGTISLNWRLVQAPIFVRDYIILHELAHVKEMNHSARFWREVARLCPDFQKAEKWLKANGELMK